MIRGLAISVGLMVGLQPALALAQDMPMRSRDGASQHENAERETTLRKVVEPVTRRTAIKRVSAAHTPSGLPVPRYVSLKSGKTNGRTGPSRDHAIAWQYKRRGLPVVVVAETERWRRVRDHNGDESWILSSLLSGERRALTLSDIDLRKSPKPGARLRARVGEGAVVSLRECREGWCEVETQTADDKRIKGWTLQSRLWGAAPL